MVISWFYKVFKWGPICGELCDRAIQLDRNVSFECILWDTFETMKVIPREVLIYETADAKCPFEDWLNKLEEILKCQNEQKNMKRV